jgi:D-alanine-D-alanine ligase
MSLNPFKIHNYINVFDKKIRVWVLSPLIQTADENIDYYYDFTQSIEEYTRVFNTFEFDWVWQPVSMDSFENIISKIQNIAFNENVIPIVLNLCDGDEVNGTPGVSVILELEKRNIIYTGATDFFYNITTSKIPMKRAFDKALVPHALWVSLYNKNASFDEVANITGLPFIVKPAVSGGSMGVGIKNVIETEQEFNDVINSLFDGYHGWNLTIDGLIAEQFIPGPEFTVFIIGSYNRPEDAVIFTPIERVFHHSLPEKERFLSFDRLWEIYETESCMPESANFYEYAIPDSSLIEEVKKIAWLAHASNNGVGYSRVDLRMNKVDNKILVLEVNAQCGISEDENYTSIGAILKASDVSFVEMIDLVLVDGVIRHLEKNKKIN